MRVLVAARVRGSRRTAGSKATLWAVEGELVRPPTPRCDDPRCACARGWVGLVSGEPAETARVVDLDLQHEGLVAAFADALFAIAGPGSDDPDHADQPCPDWVGELVDQHLDLARSRPLGDLVPLGDAAPEPAHLPLSA